jgi:hypothetical protein
MDEIKESIFMKPITIDVGNAEQTYIFKTKRGEIAVTVNRNNDTDIASDLIVADAVADGAKIDALDSAYRTRGTIYIRSLLPAPRDRRNK